MFVARCSLFVDMTSFYTLDSAPPGDLFGSQIESVSGGYLNVPVGEESVSLDVIWLRRVRGSGSASSIEPDETFESVFEQEPEDVLWWQVRDAADSGGGGGLDLTLTSASPDRDFITGEVLDSSVLEAVPDAVKYAIDRADALVGDNNTIPPSSAVWVVGIGESGDIAGLADQWSANSLGETNLIPNTYLWQFPSNALSASELQAQLKAIDVIEFAYPLALPEAVEEAKREGDFGDLEEIWGLAGRGGTGFSGIEPDASFEAVLARETLSLDAIWGRRSPRGTGFSGIEPDAVFETLSLEGTWGRRSGRGGYFRGIEPDASFDTVLGGEILSLEEIWGRRTPSRAGASGIEPDESFDAVDRDFLTGEEGSPLLLNKGGTDENLLVSPLLRGTEGGSSYNDRLLDRSPQEGEKVTIAIVDDGLEYTHPDLLPNYDPALSLDVNEGDILYRNYDRDPAPFFEDAIFAADLESPLVLAAGESISVPVTVELTGTIAAVAPAIDSPNLAALQVSVNREEERDRVWNITIENTGNTEGAIDGVALVVDAENAHGTAVAGTIVGTGNGEIAVSGVAPDATLAGIRLTAADVGDLQIADALYAAVSPEIDIFNNSWKPPALWSGGLSLMALHRGVTEGRDGLGNIYVFGSGNDWFPDEGYAENLNYNSLASSRYSIAVGAVTAEGMKAPYSQEGAALLVSAPVGDKNAPRLTTDLTGTAGKNRDGTGEFGANLANLDYTNDFDGTSAAAPVVSGTVARMLAANPDLTWRDVQHILVETSDRALIRDRDPGWAGSNGEIQHSHKYGFGVVDPEAAVQTAIDWVNVAPEVRVKTEAIEVDRPLPDGGEAVADSVTVTENIAVETVEVAIDARHSFRGDLEIELTSPSGVKSVLVAPLDDGGDDIRNWVFSSVRHWGESSAGEWTLAVRDTQSGEVGTWKSWALNLYGTKG